MRTSAWLWAIALAWRLACVALTRSYANPDEYWQAPEVAHKLVYGVGYTTWEWWPEFRIRSGIHPLLLSLPLWLLRVVGVDSPAAVAACPKIAHALLTAGRDVLVFRLTRVIMRQEGSTAREADTVAAIAFVSSIFSWFEIFCGARAFINGVEAVTVLAGLYFWYRSLSLTTHAAARRDVTIASFLAGLSVVLRPTSLTVWSCVGLGTLLRLGARSTLQLLASRILLPALAGIGVGAAADSYMYGTPTLSLVSFVKLNMFMGVDKLYGVYPWYWYLSEGITAMCGTQIPFVLIGVFMCRRRSAVEIVGIMAWSLFVLSCAAHKEHRFLLPVSSLFNIVAARGWFVLWRAHTLRRSRAPQDEDAALLKKARVLDGEHSEHAGPQGHAQQVSSAAENAAAARLEPYWAPSLNLFRVGVAGVIIANLVAATYINCFHQRGSIHVLEHLSAASLSALTLRAGSDAGDGLPSHGGDSGAAYAGSSTAQFMDVHFLMSCHSTPFYSMLHAPAHMLQLDCSPASRLGMRMRHLPACTPASGEAGSRNASAAYDAALAARWQLGISESQLWIDAPERVLRAMYGRHPRAPALCAHARSAAGAAAMNATAVSGELNAVAGARVRTLPPVPTFGDVPPPLGCSEEDTFATPTFSFVAEFAPSLTSEPVDAHLLSWRDLPTHLVLNERSASSDVVRHFLEEFHYAPSSLFSQGHLPGDRHAAVAGPDSIVVFEHRCWTDASGSAPIVDA